MFSILNNSITIKSNTINEDIPDIKINKTQSNKYLASKHISKLQINNLATINKDITITLKHIYIDLYTFIINNETNTTACEEYKDTLLKTILQHLNK